MVKMIRLPSGDGPPGKPARDAQRHEEISGGLLRPECISGREKQARKQIIGRFQK
jgi:hypothetical protein